MAPLAHEAARLADWPAEQRLLGLKRILPKRTVQAVLRQTGHDHRFCPRLPAWFGRREAAGARHTRAGKAPQLPPSHCGASRALGVPGAERGCAPARGMKRRPHPLPAVLRQSPVSACVLGPGDLNNL